MIALLYIFGAMLTGAFLLQGILEEYGTIDPLKMLITMLASLCWPILVVAYVVANFLANRLGR